MRISDWSSDVCSSDLPCCDEPSPRTRPRRVPLPIERLRKDSEPDGGGRGQRADENENRPELVGLELITRAGVEHEVTQARAEMLAKSTAQPDKHDLHQYVGNLVPRPGQIGRASGRESVCPYV